MMTRKRLDIRTSHWNNFKRRCIIGFSDSHSEIYPNQRKGSQLKKISLRSFGLIGVLVFLPLFLFTFSDPNLIEKSARSFIEWELKNEMTKKIDSIQLPKSKKLEELFGDKAKNLRIKTEQKLEALKRQLKDDAPKIIMTQVAKTSDLTCECRDKWEERLRSMLKFKITSLEKTKEKLALFAQAKYMEIVEKLTLDIRIFLGANALIFSFLLLVSFLKPKATEHLFLPAILMLVSTVIGSYFYLFEQDWFYTIVYNDYVGFGYVAYLAIIFAVLCDIAFNKAKVVTAIINQFFNAIGSALSVSPC